MSATPEPEVRWWRHGVAVQAFPESAAPYLPGMGWTEVTVTPVVPQGAATPADADVAERIGAILREHQPTSGMQVASGVTCRCGYWTSEERPGVTRPVGYSGLVWHQAQMIATLPVAAPCSECNGTGRIECYPAPPVRTGRCHVCKGTGITHPVAATGEEVDHYPMSAISMRGTSAVCDWCGQVFESSDLYREHERVMVLARRAREAAASDEEDGRG